MPDLIVRSRQVVTPAGVLDAEVTVRDGRIASISPPAGGSAVTDLGNLWLLPGFVDSHVHINDPGRADWEGFATATSAAAVGGVTTLVDMPLNSIPATTSLEGLRAKQAAARGVCQVDVGLWGGVIPGNTGELEGLAAAGVCGFKCFLSPSGVEEFPHVSERDLREAMPVIARLGLPLLAHAELPEVLDRSADELARDPRRYASWLASRPAEAEVQAIRLLIRLSEETGCAVHVVHLAAAEALSDLRAARKRGLPITVETCPHYLYFCSEQVPDGLTHFKCAPPIRRAANRLQLQQALLAGEIDLVASDHSPCPPELKLAGGGDFSACWGGIASLGLGASVAWTAMEPLGATPAHLAYWMSEAPARLAGLYPRKGVIAVGADADLVAFDPALKFTASEGQLQCRHKLSPYLGEQLQGVARQTWLRGESVAEEWKAVGASLGQILGRARPDLPDGDR